MASASVALNRQKTVALCTPKSDNSVAGSQKQMRITASKRQRGGEKETKR
jgi:hypothetical protein